MRLAYSCVACRPLPTLRPRCICHRQRRAQTKALYAANGEYLTDAEVDQEIVADYIAKYLMSDEQGIDALVKEKPSVGRRILQWLDQLLAKLGNSDAQERAFLNRARAMYQQALQQSQSSFTDEGHGLPSSDPPAAGHLPPGEGIAARKDNGAADILEWAREAYANGDLTEEEFDSYVDLIMEKESLEDAREPAEVKHSISPVKDAIDLSKDSELAKRVSGLRGSAKYKIIQDYILEVLGDQPVTLSDGKQAVVDRSDALHIANKSADKKTAYISQIREIIETAELYAEDTDVDHNKFNYFCYYKADVRYDAEVFPIYLNVGKGINDGKYHIYDITQSIRDTADRINGLERPKPNEGYALRSGISTDSIRENTEDVNNEIDPMEQWEEEHRLKLPSLDNSESTDKRKFSISPSTVAKQDVISDLRGILQRGGDPAELRRYVARMEQSTQNPERNHENAYQNNVFAERNDGFAYQNAETAEQILGAAKRQGISVSQYLQENWEQYEVDGQWNAAARQALDQERGGRRRYSISATEATESDAPNLLKSYENVNLAEDSEVYSYSFLTAQPDMHIVTLPDVAAVRDGTGKIDTAKVVENGMKNALSVGTERAGNVYVMNRYTGRELQVTTSAVRHGLNGAINRRLTNARLGSVIGEVAQNAIPINALYDTANDVSGTYAMAGYATDSSGREFVAIVTVEQRRNSVSSVDVYDVTHAVSGRQKRSSRQEPATSSGGSQADTKSQGFNLIKASSEISIADLLPTVKDVYQSILSADVLQNLGESRDPNGHYSGRVKFSISPNPEQEAPKGLSLPSLDENTSEEDLRAALPAKARNVLQRTERELLNEICKSLSVPWLARREYLQPTVQAISNSYLRDGTVEQEQINQLFEDAYEKGVIVDAEFYNQYKHVKKHLQTTAVTISQQDQADIADFHDFRTRANKYKVLRITDNGGLPVDTAYDELRDMAPELFPANITHQADQLQRMYDVKQICYLD